MAICAICKTEFFPARCSTLCCSKECRRERNKIMNRTTWRRRNADKDPIPCAECKTPFIPRANQRMYCSKECSDASAERKRREAADLKAIAWGLNGCPFAAGMVRDWEGRRPDYAIGF